MTTTEGVEVVVSEFQPLPWTSDLSVSVRVIDDEHKVLLSVYNDLVGSIEHRDPKSVADKVVKELYGYTKYHFGHEEEMMSKLGYPELDEHRRQHAGFVNRIAEIQKHVDGGQANLASLAEFVQKWIVGHIMVTDKKLGAFLKDKLPDGDFEFDAPAMGVVP